jgi:hypothetical protein
LDPAGRRQKPKETAQVGDAVLSGWSTQPLPDLAHKKLNVGITKQRQAGRVCLVAKVIQESGGCKDVMSDGGSCESTKDAKVFAILGQQNLGRPGRLRARQQLQHLQVALPQTQASSQIGVVLRVNWALCLQEVWREIDQSLKAIRQQQSIYSAGCSEMLPNQMRRVASFGQPSPKSLQIWTEQGQGRIAFVNPGKQHGEHRSSSLVVVPELARTPMLSLKLCEAAD